VVASVPYSILFASSSKNNYDVTEAMIANKLLDVLQLEGNMPQGTGQRIHVNQRQSSNMGF